MPNSTDQCAPLTVSVNGAAGKPHVKRVEGISIIPASAWDSKAERVILASYEHFNTTKGSGLRGQIYAAANEYYEVPKNELTTIMDINYFLGAWIILLDDIEDGSDTRRGQAGSSNSYNWMLYDHFYSAAHKIYGVGQAINTSGYVFLNVMEKVAELQVLHPTEDLNKMLIDEMKYMHRGQGLEMLWRDTLRCPTEEENIDMMNKKTTSFFRLVVRLMRACASRNKDMDLVPLVDLTGVFLQIWNDYTDVMQGGKGDDIREGKFSFPIQHAITCDPENPFLYYTLSQRSDMPKLREKALKYIREETRSTEYTFSKLKAIRNQIQDEAIKLGGSQTLMRMVDGVIDSLPPS